MYPSQVSNSRSSCVSLPNAGITAVCHHTCILNGNSKTIIIDSNSILCLLPLNIHFSVPWRHVPRTLEFWKSVTERIQSENGWQFHLCACLVHLSDVLWPFIRRIHKVLTVLGKMNVGKLQKSWKGKAPCLTNRNKSVRETHRKIISSYTTGWRTVVTYA